MSYLRFTPTNFVIYSLNISCDIKFTQKMSPSFFHLSHLLLLIVSCFSKQLVFSKQNERYMLKMNIGNLKINLQPQISLGNRHSWIKSETCKLCVPINQKQNSKSVSNVVKYKDKSYDCSQSCFEKSQEQYGLKCIQTHNKCQVINENAEVSLGSKVFKGKFIKVKGQASENHLKLDQIQILMVNQIFSIETSVQKGSLTKAPQTGKKYKQHTFDPNNHIGEYSVWGRESLFENNIVTKNSKNQIVIYDAIKQNKLEKQILEDVTPIDVEFEETVTQFSLSQIKLGEKITLNHPQKETQDHQFPILPLQKGFFTLQSQNLHLPKKQYQKLTKFVIQTYFSSEKNKCELKDSKISCEKAISLDQVEYLKLQLILNGISVGFPFKVLLKNYKRKTCDLKITETDSTFSIGTFFFEVFAVEFIKETENLRFHRLNNQWNKFYSKDEKYHKENFNIFWWMGTSVFYIFYWVFKILFYFAIFSLLINCVYHWRKVMDWMGKIVDRIKRKRGQGELFQEDQDLQAKDTAKLIRKFKNRPKKVFVQDNPSVVDQITTQQSN